ncbi:hypothetical protein ACWGID_18585 [Kribbella sp. NPDC054772]
MGLLGTAKAVAAVPFEQVEPLLTEDRCKVLLGLDGGNPAGVSVDADPAAATIGLQGQFWYRGEYTFAPHAGGTEVTYRLENVSSWPDPVIALWQRKTVKAVQRAADSYAAALPGRVT